MASLPSAVAVEALTEVAVTVRIIDSDRNPVPESPTPREVTLYFPFIGGAWFAEAREASGIRKRARVGDRLRFDLSALRARVDEMARPWPEGRGTSSVRVTPPDARVVHVGVAGAHDDGTAFADHTLFMDAATKERLLLIYADRPCRLRGDGSVESRTVAYEVDLPVAGFHWVRVTERATERGRLTVVPSAIDAILGLQVVVGSETRSGGLPPEPGREELRGPANRR